MDGFSLLTIVAAIGFHLFLTFMIIGYICYKDCRGKSCTCPCRKRIVEQEEEIDVAVDDGPEQERPIDQMVNDSTVQHERTRVNVYFTNRWVSSLASRIQTYVNRGRRSNSLSNPTIVVTGNAIDSEDDDNEGLPSYNEALSLEIDYLHPLASPPSYEELFVDLQETKL